MVVTVTETNAVNAVKKKKVKPTHCAPSRYEHAKATGSCLTPTEIVRVASTVLPGSQKLWNKKDVAMAVRLRDMIHKVMGTKEGEEERWLSASALKRDRALHSELAEAFRPARPPSWNSNPRQWLNTNDIHKVMKQYEKRHRGFYFVGVFPRDFETKLYDKACVSQQMCDLTIESLVKTGRKSAGMVFNMDTHTQSGSHWTACYIGLDPSIPNRYGVWYYDSVATPPPKEIAAFMSRIYTEALKRLPIFAADGVTRFQNVHNAPRTRKQFLNTECGVYSCFFIVASLCTKHPFPVICDRIMRDDNTMHQLRDVFFREASSS